MSTVWELFGDHMPWADAAACGSGVDPELFFPVATGPAADAAAVRAKAVCAGCPVIRECREHALRTGATGIWGGTTEAERAEARGTQVVGVAA